MIILARVSVNNVIEVFGFIIHYIGVGSISKNQRVETGYKRTIFFFKFIIKFMYLYNDINMK